MKNPIKSLKNWRRLLLTLKKTEKRFTRIEDNIENLVNAKYPSLIKQESYKTKLANKEYSISSQNGEDGLLLYIFNEIGIVYSKAIEFGIGDGKECNTANLIKNFGWNVLMIEGNTDSSNKARQYYDECSKTSPDQVKIINEFITKDNINDLFRKGKVSGEIDLLSIDIDGNDYWVWKAIDCVNPRVVVIEYNASFGPTHSVSVKYEPDFYRFDKHESGWYHGASLTALWKLGKKKGYELVACDSHGVNAFFIRNDIPLTFLQKSNPEDVYYDEWKRSKRLSQEQQFEKVKYLPLVEI